LVKDNPILAIRERVFLFYQPGWSGLRILRINKEELAQLFWDFGGWRLKTFGKLGITFSSL